MPFLSPPPIHAQGHVTGTRPFSVSAAWRVDLGPSHLLAPSSWVLDWASLAFGEPNCSPHLDFLSPVGGEPVVFSLSLGGASKLTASPSLVYSFNEPLLVLGTLCLRGQ